MLPRKKVILSDVILAERFKQIHLQKQEKYLTLYISIKIKSYFYSRHRKTEKLHFSTLVTKPEKSFSNLGNSSLFGEAHTFNLAQPQSTRCQQHQQQKGWSLWRAAIREPDVYIKCCKVTDEEPAHVYTGAQRHESTSVSLGVCLVSVATYMKVILLNYDRIDCNNEI